MNINDIPPELLLHVFRFMSHKELTRTLDKVCILWKELVFSPSLWKVIEYSSTVNDFSHLQVVQDYVQNLTISPGHVINIFGFNKTIQFANLKSLAFSGNIIVSEVFFDNIIRRCPRLESLKIIGDNRFNFEHCLEKITELSLTSVDICYFYGTQSLDAKLVDFLKSQPKLQNLALRGWQSLTDSTVSLILRNFTTLTSLYISNDSITDKAFTDCSKATNLRELTIHCPLLTDVGLTSLIRRCTALTKLEIKLSKDITDVSINEIAKQCRQLQSVSFGNINPENCERVTNNGIISIAECCPNIKSVSTMGCKNILDDGVRVLSLSWKQLSFLSLNGCTEIQDSSLFSIGDHCKNLQNANFSNCFKITTSGALYLILNCKWLLHLTLAFCTGIGDVEDNKAQYTYDKESDGYFSKKTDLALDCSKIRSLDRRHSHITHLNLRSCDNITTKTVLKFVSHCPDLRKLSLLGTLKHHADGGAFSSQVFSCCQFVETFSIHNTHFYRRSKPSFIKYHTRQSNQNK